MTDRIPLIVNQGAAQIQELSTGDNLSLPANSNISLPGAVVTGSIYTDGYYYANGQPFSGGGGGSGNVFVTSNVVSVTAGLPILVAFDNANITYPGGVFTIYQPSSNTYITMSDTWTSSGTASKNQYTDFANSVVNTSNIAVTLAVSGGTFNVQSSDNIVIGGSVITGANLLGLGISGTGGTYTIPAADFAGSVQTAASTAVTAHLTVTGGQQSASGTTLTTVAPVPFNFTSITGAFPSPTVAIGSLNQSFTWNANGVTGTVLSSNVELTGAYNVQLSNTTATTGTSASINSTLSPFTLTATYTGNGTNGAGTSTVIHVGSVTPATVVTPLFYKYTASSANPNFVVSDPNLGIAFNPNGNQGANTNGVVSDYNWIAVPTSQDTNLSFHYSLPPFPPATVTPDAFFGNVDIGGVSYDAYGFTTFSAVAYIYITSP